LKISGGTCLPVLAAVIMAFSQKDVFGGLEAGCESAK
jgi:hypothetical protein